MCLLCKAASLAPGLSGTWRCSLKTPGMRGSHPPRGARHLACRVAPRPEAPTPPPP